jgi:hypothetical protein
MNVPSSPGRVRRATARASNCGIVDHLNLLIASLTTVRSMDQSRTCAAESFAS